MRNVGITVLVASLALAGLLLFVWLLGLVFAFGGGLIHLLLLAAIILGPAGVLTGIVLIILGGGRGGQR